MRTTEATTIARADRTEGAERTASSAASRGHLFRGDTPLTVLAAATLWASRPALAGPNGGGTLIVHDTGLGYSSTSYLYPSTPPIDCASTDNEMPVEIAPGSLGRVWKVYAAFAPGSSPRLKSLAFGEAFDGAQMVVSSGGLPDAADGLAIPQNGWPSANGGGVGITFNTTMTATINEVYWFGGYAVEQAPGLWATTPHPVQVSEFVDDAFPAHADLIAGFSSIGFGLPGTTVCPLPECACCFGDGTCLVLSPAACEAAGGSFELIAVCTPNPCPQTGACCFLDETCQTLDATACAQMGGLNQGYGTPCEPNPCPNPGACCFASGYCFMWDAAHCAHAGGWHQGYDTFCSPNPCDGLAPPCCLQNGWCLMLPWDICEGMAGGTALPGVPSCEPNPCPQPPPSTGSCCYPDGSCQVLLHADCSTGHWHAGFDCDPNPCPQIGACCHRDGACEFSLPAECADLWIAGICEPNPCPALEGACCLTDGSCAIRLMLECELEFAPNAACDAQSIPCPNLVGACCSWNGLCQVLARWECDALGGSIMGDVCTPILCPAGIPVQRTSWGRIKEAYR